MPPDYRVFVHTHALDTLPKTGKRRNDVIDFLHMLGEIAHFGGDYTKHDPESDRVVHVSEVSGFSITWWTDEPVMEVKVVDIARTSRQ